MAKIPAEKQRSIERVADREKRRDAKEREKIAKSVSTVDSFINFTQKMGVGADNPLSTASYGFNPVTRTRTRLEFIHRGSWIGGMAVDIPAEDMTRAGAELDTQLDPEQMKKIHACAVELRVWHSLCSAIKWGRLYGGGLAVMMIDGQRYDTPLRLETIGKDQFKGLLVFDRWMLDPSMNDLVTEQCPDIGLPKFYNVLGDAPALPRMKIHYSRCIRFTGIELPYYQRVQENLWSISVLERLYDRMLAFDSATTGAAQLVYKAWLRTYKIKDLRSIVAAGGQGLNAMVRYVDMMRRFQNIEGVTLLDAEDDMTAMQHSAFGGLSDVILQFGQQLSGALGIPLVRLFGQSPAGLNATGESDLRMYYDNINKIQNSDLLIPVTRIYQAIAKSKGVQLPEGTLVKFNSLWQLTDKEKAEIAEITGRAVGDAEERGLISQKTAMQELKQSSRVTGVFSNISDEDIDSAEETLPPAGEAAASQEHEQAMALATAKLDEKGENKSKTADAAVDSISGMKRAHDLDVIVENEKGSTRRGAGWEARLAADYGYVRRTKGSDGDELDCFIGPNPESNKVFVISQRHLDGPLAGQFDEFKCLLGFDDLPTALLAYTGSYSDDRGLERIEKLDAMDVNDFKKWIESSGQKALAH